MTKERGAIEGNDRDNLSCRKRSMLFQYGAWTPRAMCSSEAEHDRKTEEMSP